MLYWLMDLRYRQIASEWLYHHYLHKLTQREDVHRRCPSLSARQTETEYDCSSPSLIAGLACGYTIVEEGRNGGVWRGQNA